MKRIILWLSVILVGILVGVGISYAADISLKWDASSGATGYKIYKSEDGGTTWNAGVDVGNVVTYTYTGVVETALILFRVSAYSQAGEAIRLWSGAWYDHRKLPVQTPSGAGIQ